MSPRGSVSVGTQDANKVVATRFIHGFNDNDWDSVREVVAPDVVVALGPPQADRAAATRNVEVYRIEGGSPNLVYRNELITDPPYGGDPAVDREVSRAVVERWIAGVLDGHDVDLIGELATEHLLIHPTAMPCESSYHGAAGARAWLEEQWRAMADLTLVGYDTVAQGDIVVMRWTARGTSVRPFMGVPPTGGHVEFTGLSMYRLEGDQIAEIWDTRNTLGILQQLDPGLGAGGHHH